MLECLHDVEVGTYVRRLRNKSYSFKKKRASGFIDDCIAKNNGVAEIIHFSSYGKRLADSETEVSVKEATE
jgi:hypothetical protein